MDHKQKGRGNPALNSLCVLVFNTNALNTFTWSLRATNGSVAISLHKYEIASSFPAYRQALNLTRYRAGRLTLPP
jgi:hypothetical protein